jgi:hypothetical protein
MPAITLLEKISMVIAAIRVQFIAKTTIIKVPISDLEKLVLHQ